MRPLFVFALSTVVITFPVTRGSVRPAPDARRSAAASLRGGFERRDSDRYALASTGGRETALLGTADASLTLLDDQESPMCMRVVGARDSLRAEPFDALPGRVNYLIGNIPARWRTDVIRYRGLRYSNVYPGIDLVYRATDGGVEYDFNVAPGGDPEQIRLRFDTKSPPDLIANGDLVLRTGRGDIRHRKPRVWQGVGKKRHHIDGTFRATRDGIGFSLGEFDRFAPLTIDPEIVFSTSFGGGFFDFAFAIDVDARGHAYVAGTTESTILPTTPGVVQPRAPRSPNAFVAKLDSAGNVIYLTYLGGNNARATIRGSTERAAGIAVDALGQVVVAGATDSTDFPTVNALKSQAGGGVFEGFVAKLNPSGSELVYSTYFGAENTAVAIDGLGSAYVAGFGAGNSFTQILGSLKATAFVAKFNPAGGLVYATRLGSSGGAVSDRATALAVDGAGQAVVVGQTSGSDFPLVHPALTKCPASCQSSFTAKLNTAGTGFVYSTYTATSDWTQASAVAIDVDGSAYVAGWDGRAFVVRYNTQGEITFSERFLEYVEQYTVRLALGSRGVYLAGTTNSITLPPVDALLPDHPRGPVYRSVDSGSRWVPASRGMLAQPTSFSFDSVGTVYGTGYSGVVKSVDDGLTWRAGKALTSIGFPATVARLAIDTHDPSAMFASDGFSRAIYKSVDGGNSWTPTSPTSLRSVLAIAIDPAHSSIVYVGGSGGINKSVDGGLAWTSANTGLTFRGNELAVFSLVIAPTNPSTVYAVTHENVFKSTDGAATWALISSALPLSNDSIPLVVDPFSPNILYAAIRQVFKSTDSGATWAPAATGLPNVRVSALIADPRVLNTLYAGAAAAGPEAVWKTTNGGASWFRSGSGIQNDTLFSLGIAPRTGTLFATGKLTPVPFLIRFVPGETQPRFSTYLPFGTGVALATGLHGDVFVGISDRGIVVQRITSVPDRPRALR